MKRLVTEEDLTADPSLASIGVKIGDEYDFEDAPADEPKVAKFDPFTGLPLEAPAEEVAPAEVVAEPAPVIETASIEADKPAEEAAEVVDSPVEEVSEEPAAVAEVSDSPAIQPITYADILERGLSLNKIEAANLHPGISQIAQWGDLVARQEFKPAE